MHLLSPLLTMLFSAIAWLLSLLTVTLLGWLVFCWQCGADEHASVWLFWPLVYALAVLAVFLLARLPLTYGGERFGLGVATVVAVGLIMYYVSA